jgi:hypothetical protein
MYGISTGLSVGLIRFLVSKNLKSSVCATSNLPNVFLTLSFDRAIGPFCRLLSFRYLHGKCVDYRGILSRNK